MTTTLLEQTKCSDCGHDPADPDGIPCQIWSSCCTACSMTDGHTHVAASPAPAPPTVGDPMAECARCSSTETFEVRDSAGVPLLVRCVACGHVLSLVALRALAGRLGQAPAVDLAEELHRLVGVPFWPVPELQGVGDDVELHLLAGSPLRAFPKRGAL